MLTTCPECQLQVSDKAITCPHCGYPLDAETVKRGAKKSKKHRRLPNGFGSISKIDNKNLRKRYRAMVTIEKLPDGTCKRRILQPEGYFETYNDAYNALAEYHKNPYDLDSILTVKELYEKWSEQYFPTLKNRSSIRTVTCAWAYCSSIYSMRAADVRPRHIKGCMEEGVAIFNREEHHPTPHTKARIKSMFNLMFDYALEYEIVDKNYARSFDLSGEITENIRRDTKEHIPYTEEEMEKLWNNANIIPYTDVVLIQCYSGWRPQELGLIRMEDVNLEEGYFRGGMKTEAGTNRIVPIHPRIRPLVEARYQEAKQLGSEYLINCTDTTTHRSSLLLTYDKYQHRFAKIRDRLGLNPEHRAHDGRKQFITMAKKAGVDEYAIKYIVGHTITDLTERVYTQREFSWLQEEIQKIK